MTWEEKEAIRGRFTVCLRKATELLRVVSRQDCTNPTYHDLQDIMSRRSGLDDKSSYMEEELSYFLNYDEMFVNKAPFYEEISALARATEETVDDALSLSGRFLQRVTDVDGIFQSSKIACLQLASDIMAFVDKDMAINPAEARQLQGNLW